VPILTLKQIVSSLDDNLQFVSELLQADIRLFVKENNHIYIHNYYHPNQDSLYLGPRQKTQSQGEKLLPHRDISISKAFRLGKAVVGQYGMVINNRRIQEFAYPIFLEDSDTDPVAVIAVERDIYTTRTVLGQHWDFVADFLIKALKQKIQDNLRLPQIAFGEGALILQGKNVFFANPLAVNLLSEIAEHARQLIGRPIDDLFSNFSRKFKGDNKQSSIVSIEEIGLRQRTILLRYVKISEEMTVALIKDGSELKIQETLLKEIHHRVKNNLQTIISLLRLQKRRHPELENAFSEAINRTNSIALVHEYLSRSNDIESIDLGFMMQKILKGLLSSFGADHITINFDCAKKIFIQSENATNLALVFNEILTNTLEHTAEKVTKINIIVYSDDSQLHMIVEDNGGGFKEGFDYKASTGLGWEIIRTITEESLKGKLSVENIVIDSSMGLKVHLTVPL
jgi:two-component sensor histidine kinase